MFSPATLLVLATSALASSVLWDGRANEYNSSAFLGDWSWSNQVGPYQYYIHGKGATDEYAALNETYKNPDDAASSRGWRITIDNTSVWNSETMLRTELIPQTSAPINKGKVYYHFSIQHTDVNAPSISQEHQICFFESHFTELKYGLISGAQGTNDSRLQWMVQGQGHWAVNLTADTWHNIAYAIDFDAGTVGLYHSEGADDLELAVSPVSASTSSNGADWHLGLLRLASPTAPADITTEDWYFSGIYIETGNLTTSVTGPTSK